MFHPYFFKTNLTFLNVRMFHHLQGPKKSRGNHRRTIHFSDVVDEGLDFPGFLQLMNWPGDPGKIEQKVANNQIF